VLSAGESTVYALSTHGLFRLAGGAWAPVLSDEEWPEGAHDALPRNLVVV
jgi:hypothetical protein